MTRRWLRYLWYEHASDLRAQPQFRQLVERIGLLEYRRQSGWPDLCRRDGESFACD